MEPEAEAAERESEAPVEATVAAPPAYRTAPADRRWSLDGPGRRRRGRAPCGADVPRRAVLERSVAPAAEPFCRPRAAPALAALLVAARLALRAGLAQAERPQQAAARAPEMVPPRATVGSRANEAVDFLSCNSTTRRRVSSRRAVWRADTQAAIGRTNGITSGIQRERKVSPLFPVLVPAELRRAPIYL